MKKVLFLISLIIIGFISKSQNNGIKTDDIGRIACTVYIDESKTVIPSDAYSVLKNKLTQIVAKNGMASTLPQRFIVTANIDVLTKDITATTPPMCALTLNVNFYIGDGVKGVLYNSASITAKGVGETEDKAYLAALKTIKVNSPEIINMLNKGKQEIVSYYNANCDLIMAEAESLAASEQYDDAILVLASIPDVCKDCYDNAMNRIGEIYIKKIDAENHGKFAEAKGIWNTKKDEESATSAYALLADINPNVSYYKDVERLGNQIAAYLTDNCGKETARIDYSNQRYDSDNGDSRPFLRRLVDFAVTSVAVFAAKTAIVYNAIKWW